jgi:hypothetical protein
MIVEYDGKKYEFDMDEITVQQAKIIKTYCGLNMATISDALEEADPDAMAALFWLMKQQNGERVQIQTVDFKLLKFANALNEASERESKEKEELEIREAQREKAKPAKAASPKGQVE